MSRIGKKPVAIPSGVTVNVQGSKVSVKGPKGELSRELPPFITAKVNNGQVEVACGREDKESKAIFGTTRSLIANMVRASQGYSKDLEIQGVGFRANLQGKKLVLSLGYSHPDRIHGSGRHYAEGGGRHGAQRQRSGQAAGGSGQRADPGLLPAGALQGQGRPVQGRTRAPESRQDGGLIMKLRTRTDYRTRRHLRVRQKVKGTAERPRMSVFVSNKHMYVQFIDDVAARPWRRLRPSSRL